MKKIIVFIICIVGMSNECYTQGITFISPPFEYYSTTDSIYQYLCTKLPRLICEGIVSNTNIIYRNASSLSDDGRKKLNYFSQNKAKPYLEDTSLDNILKEVNADYILTGQLTYQEFDFPKYKLETSVNDLKGKKFDRDITANSEKELCSGVDELSKYYNRVISGRKNIKIYVTSMDSNSINSFNKYFYDNYSHYVFFRLSMIDTLDVEYSIVYFDTAKIREFAANDTSFDYIISGTFANGKKRSYVIQPIVFRKSDRTFSCLAEIKGYRKKRRITSTSGEYELYNNIYSELFLQKRNQEHNGEKYLESKAMTSIDSQRYYLANMYIRSIKDRDKRSFLYAKLISERDHDYQSALDSITRLLPNNNDEKLSLLAGQLNYYLRNYYASLDELSIINNKSKLYEKRLLVEGLCLYKLKIYDSAITIFTKQLKYTSDTLTTFVKIGDCYKEIKNYEKAEEYYMRTYALDKANAKYQYPLAKFYAERGRHYENYDSLEVAKEFYDRAYSIYRLPEYHLRKLHIDLRDSVDDITFFKIASNFILGDTGYQQYVNVLEIERICLRAMDSINERAQLNRIVWTYDFYRRNTNDSSLSFYKSIGSAYFDVLNVDSAEYYYEKAYMKEADFGNLFNLIEASIMNKDEQAIIYLQKAKQNLSLINKNESTIYTKLYYFYFAELLAKEGKDFSNEKDTLTALISSDIGQTKERIGEEGYLSDYVDIFYGWRFKTFAKWVNTIGNEETKKKMNSLLCGVLPYTTERDIYRRYCKELTTSK